MNLLWTTLIIVTVPMLLALVLCRVLRRTTSIDHLWRLTLIVVAVTPVIVVCREPVRPFQWNWAILPGASVQQTNTDADQPVASASSVHNRLDRRSRKPPTDHPAAAQAIANQPTDRTGAGTETSRSRSEADKPLAAGPAPVTGAIGAFASLVRLIGIAWITGTAFLCFRTVRAFGNAFLITRSAQPVNDSKPNRLNETCAKQAGVALPARLATSPQVQGPVVTGIVFPTIIVPAEMTDEAHQNDLRATLLHEYGHVRRCDVAFDLLLRLVVAGFWLHPLVHVMASQIRRLREEICDNYVLIHESPIHYSEVLLRLAVGQNLNESLLIGLGIVPRPQRLENRIADILASDRQIAIRTSAAWRWASAVMVVAVLGSSLLVRLVKVAAQPPAENQTNAQVSAQTNAPPAEDLGFKVRVITVDGRPVVGAKVSPRDVYINGGQIGAESDPALTVQTDDDGYATVHLSERIRTHKIGDKVWVLPIDQIRLHIDHPDHPVWEDSHYVAKPTGPGFGPRILPSYVVEDDDWQPKPIVLKDSTTIVVRTEFQGRSEIPSHLYPQLSKYLSHDYSTVDGVLTVRRVDLSSENGSRRLQVFHVPAEGLCWFSDVIDLKHLAGDPIRVNATLKPGVRVEGRIDDAVPRPVKNGRVVGMVHALQGSDPVWMWEVAAEISPDGAFAFETVPSAANLQLIALCDGFLSRPTSVDDVKEYSQAHGVPKPDEVSMETVVQLFPQLYWTGNTTLKLPAIPMQPMASCKVITVDAQDRPLPGITVAFSPNHFFYGSGSRQLGYGYDEATYIRKKRGDSIGTASLNFNDENGERFFAKTNKEGVAVVSGLPGSLGDPERPVVGMFTANGENLVPVFPNSYPEEYRDFHILHTPLKAGETTSMTVRMIPVADVADEEKDTRDDEDPVKAGIKEINLIRGRVVDEAGKPMEGVSVLVDLVDILKVRTDAQGQFHHKFEQQVWEQSDFGHGPPAIPVQFVKDGLAPHLMKLPLGNRDNTITLHTKPYFEGVVTGTDGKPVPHVRVKAFQRELESDDVAYPEIATETQTDAEGRYRLRVQPSDYVIVAGNSSAEMVWLPRWEEPDAGANPRSQDERPRISIRADETRQLDIQLEAGIDFKARFVDSQTGEPIPKMQLVPLHYPEMQYLSFDEQGMPKYPTSDDAGLISIPMLSKGITEFSLNLVMMDNARYPYLTIWSDDATEAWKKAAQAQEKSRGHVNGSISFHLRPEQPVITIKMEKGVIVQGTVVDPDGRPVNGALVQYHASGAASGTRPFRGQTSASGEFRLTIPASGASQVRLVAFESQPAKNRQWASGFVTLKPLDRGEQASDVEIRLTRPGRIKGRIVDRQGNPVASVFVQAVAADYADTKDSVASTVCGRDGRFSLSNVGPGRHKITGRKGLNDESTNDRKEIVVESGKDIDVGDVFVPVED